MSMSRLRYNKFCLYSVVEAGLNSGVTRGSEGGRTAEGKKFWANLQRIVEKRGRTNKNRHPGGGDTRVKAIKSDSDSDSDEEKIEG